MYWVLKETVTVASVTILMGSLSIWTLGVVPS